MRESLFTIFEYAATFFEGFLIVKFVYDYCGYRLHVLNRRIALFVSQLLFSCMIVVFNKITSFESIGVFAYIVILFIMAAAFLEGSLIQKLFVSLFPILCTVIISAVTMPMVAAISNIPLLEVYSNVGLERAVGVIVTKVALFCIFKIIVPPSKEKKEIMLTNAEWIQVILVSIASMLIIDTAISFQLQYIQFPMNRGVIFIIIGVFVLDLYLLYVILKINRYNRIKQENELLKQQQVFNAKYAENVQKQYEEIKTLRHDWKHSLSALSVLVSGGNIEEASSYISRYSETIEAPSSYIETENELLNAIVNSKLSQAYQYKIKTSCAVSTACKQIDGIDLCNLLGNLLDNAIEASLKIPIEKAEISLKIWSAPNKTMIFIKNAITDSILQNNSRLKTDKPSKQSHGIGMKTIKTIVDKYNGLTDIYEEDNYFCVLITLFA